MSFGLRRKKKKNVRERIAIKHRLIVYGFNLGTTEKRFWEEKVFVLKQDVSVYVKVRNREFTVQPLKMKDPRLVVSFVLGMCPQRTEL